MYALLDSPGFKNWPVSVAMLLLQSMLLRPTSLLFHVFTFQLHHSREPINVMVKPSDLVYLSADATAVIDKLEDGKVG